MNNSDETAPLTLTAERASLHSKLSVHTQRSGLPSRLVYSLMQRARGINPWLLLLVPTLYLVTISLIGNRFPIVVSYAPNVIWGYEWAQQFREGVLYPRWLEHTFAGIGSPTFHFYGPLCMYAMLPFSVGLGLSISHSMLLSFWLALTVMAIGMARLTDLLVGREHRWLSGALAVMVVLAPYTINDVYVRGALAEVWGMAIFPWVLSALFRSVESTRFSSRLSLIVATAAFALTHPPTLMFGMGAITLATLVTTRSWQQLGAWLRRGFVPIATGLALDAHYLISAIRDQAYVDINALTPGQDLYAMNRVLMLDLGRLSSKTAEGYDGTMVPGFIFCCLAIALALRLLHRRSPAGIDVNRERLTFLLAVAAGAALMMTDLARGVYSLLPTLNKTQFAWRWMAILTIASLPLWGHVLLHTTSTHRHRDAVWRIPIWLVTIWASTQAFSTPLSMVDWNRPDQERTDRLLTKYTAANYESDAGARPVKAFRGLLWINAKDELVLEDVPEYRPKTRNQGGLPPRTFPLLEWSRGHGETKVLEWTTGKRRFTVDSPTGGVLLVRTAAWLGWQVDIDGDTFVGDTPGDWGRMALRVPQGHSNVSIWYRGTPNQRLGQLVSFAVLLGLLSYCAVLWRQKRLSLHG